MLSAQSTGHTRAVHLPVPVGVLRVGVPHRQLLPVRKGIAAEPLSGEPNEEFAYSGAGYCVLGRVAEVVAGKPFDELLAVRICQPLKLSRTTYFPPVDDDNVATGHAMQDGRLSVVELPPHPLRKQHKLALVGGSIYAPAYEAAEFARMLLQKGNAKGQEVLSLTQGQLLRPNPVTTLAAGFTIRPFAPQSPCGENRNIPSIRYFVGGSCENAATAPRHQDTQSRSA